MYAGGSPVEEGEAVSPPRRMRSRSRSRSPNGGGDGAGGGNGAFATGGRGLMAIEGRGAHNLGGAGGGGRQINYRGGGYQRREPYARMGGDRNHAERDRDGIHAPTGAYHFRNLATLRSAFVETYTKLYALHSSAVRGKPVTASALSEAMSVAGKILACPVCYEVVNNLSDEVFVAGCAHVFHKNGSCWQHGMACPACAALNQHGGRGYAT